MRKYDLRSHTEDTQKKLVHQKPQQMYGKAIKRTHIMMLVIGRWVLHRQISCVPARELKDGNKNHGNK